MWRGLGVRVRVRLRESIPEITPHPFFPDLYTEFLKLLSSPFRRTARPVAVWP
jgi:hypothetical protein